MEPQEMAEWAYSHACEGCHGGQECKLDACYNATEVSEFLKRLERFEGTDANGNSVRGWFVPDAV